MIRILLFLLILLPLLTYSQQECLEKLFNCTVPVNEQKSTLKKLIKKDKYYEAGESSLNIGYCLMVKNDTSARMYFNKALGLYKEEIVNKPCKKGDTRPILYRVAICYFLTENYVDAKNWFGKGEAYILEPCQYYFRGICLLKMSECNLALKYLNKYSDATKVPTDYLLKDCK